MIRQFLLATLGVMLLGLGLIGLIVPVLPGVLFLALAAACFSCCSPALQRKLEQSPLWMRFQKLTHRARRRWLAGRGLPVLSRLRLAFWLTADTLFRGVRGPG